MTGPRYEYRIIDKNGERRPIDSPFFDELSARGYAERCDTRYFPEHAPHRVQRRQIGEWEELDDSR